MTKTVYKITFTTKTGTRDTLESLTREEVKQVIWDRLTKDPDCCANVIISEFEEETPNKSWVKLERYEHRNGAIQCIAY